MLHLLFTAVPLQVCYINGNFPFYCWLFCCIAFFILNHIYLAGLMNTRLVSLLYVLMWPIRKLKDSFLIVVEFLPNSWLTQTATIFREKY